MSNLKTLCILFALIIVILSVEYLILEDKIDNLRIDLENCREQKAEFVYPINNSYITEQVIIEKTCYANKTTCLGWTYGDGKVHVVLNESKEIMWNVCNHEMSHPLIDINGSVEEEMLDNLWGHLYFKECNFLLE